MYRSFEFLYFFQAGFMLYSFVNTFVLDCFYLISKMCSSYLTITTIHVFPIRGKCCESSNSRVSPNLSCLYEIAFDIIAGTFNGNSDIFPWHVKRFCDLDFVRTRTCLRKRSMTW